MVTFCCNSDPIKEATEPPCSVGLPSSRQPHRAYADRTVNLLGAGGDWGRGGEGRGREEGGERREEGGGERREEGGGEKEGSDVRLEYTPEAGTVGHSVLPSHQQEGHPNTQCHHHCLPAQLSHVQPHHAALHTCHTLSQGPEQQGSPLLRNEYLAVRLRTVSPLSLMSDHYRRYQQIPTLWCPSRHTHTATFPH